MRSVPSSRVARAGTFDARSLATVLGLAAMAFAGCKSIAPPMVDSDGGGSGGSNSGSGGSKGGSGSGGGNGADMAVEKFSAGDMDNTDGACSAVKSEAKLVPLDLYVMMDSSKSMNDTDSNNVPKWTSLKNAMSNFFTDMNSAGFSVALKYFPEEQSGVPEVCSSDSDCKSNGPCDQRKACVGKGTFTMVPQTLCSSNTDCASTEECVAVQHCTMGPNCMARNCVAASDASTPCPSDCMAFTGYCRGRDICDFNNYSNPTVAFGELPGAANDLISNLNGHAPSGYTPTGPALQGALTAARKRAMDVPDHRVAVVLVTDGLPGAFIPKMAPAACTPPDAQGVADLLAGKTDAMLGLSATPSIPTFVIGLFGPCDLQQGNMLMPKETLATWATAGGTMNAVIVDTSMDVTKQIQDAFKQVQSKVIACQYAVPKDVVGGIDFDKVNVDFSSKQMTMPTSIHYVGSKDKCDASSGGWYYDQDPKMGGHPTQIIACDKSCSDFRSAEDANVDIALGCATVL